MAWEASPAEVEAVVAELGRCLYLYQAMEHHLKLVLPFLAGSDDQVPPKPELAGNWRALLESKKTMGALVQLLTERTTSGDKEGWEMAWRRLVEQRNQVVHHFGTQPFGRLSSPQDYQQALSFLQERRQAAIPFFEVLQAISEAVVQVVREQLPATSTGR